MPAGSLSELRIPSNKPRNTAVADSWEEEFDDDNGPKPLDRQRDLPLAPPPTPATPAPGSSTFASHDNQDGGLPWLSSSSAAASSGPARRPEKTTAVAGRLIAGALGVKAPKKTEEQRAYEKAVKEQELKRREKEKSDAQKQKEDEQKAKKAIWDD